VQGDPKPKNKACLIFTTNLTYFSDKWWDKRYPKNSASKAKAAEESDDHGQNPYSAYRDTIDFLIVDKVEWLIRSNLLFNTDEGAPLDVAELCGGDGSLAVHIMEQLEGHKLLNSYVMLERNKVLLKNAKGKLSKWGEKSKLINVDTAADDGQELIGTLEPPPDFWIASGSTLCGQVGSAAMAEPTLLQMSRVLKPGGFMVITGFTTTFFTPSLLAKANLKVHHASMPSVEASGLETDVGLFHMWVLEKQQVMKDK
jgi:ubiquinone/menaquinone biosynthesis C-methylase UbiE